MTATQSKAPLSPPGRRAEEHFREQTGAAWRPGSGY